jgi:predicted TIM-barrel fold metal-dependent hydrolase
MVSRSTLQIAMTVLAIKVPHFHVDTAASVLDRLPLDFVQWMKVTGRCRVMFGTNWPMLLLQRGLQALDALGPDVGQYAGTLYGKARRAFRQLGEAACTRKRCEPGRWGGSRP